MAEAACSKSTVNYYAKKLGTAKRLRVYDWKVVQAYHDQGNRLAECRRYFGFSSDAWDKAVRRGEIIPRPWKIPLEAILTSGSNTIRLHINGVPDDNRRENLTLLCPNATASPRTIAGKTRNSGR